MIVLCLSSECLSKDKFLRTQMDYDQFIPISIVAELEDVKKITESLMAQSKMDAIIKTLQGEQKRKQPRHHHHHQMNS